MKRRGSILIYVMILIAIISLVVVAYAGVSGAAVKSEMERESIYTAKAALDGAAVALQDTYSTAPYSLPQTNTYQIGNVSVSATATDNSANMARTMVVTATVSQNGSQRILSKVVGKRYTSVAPNTYALFVGGNDSTSAALSSLSPTLDAAVYVGGNMTGSGSAVIAGDLLIAKANTLASTSAASVQVGASTIVPPAVVATTYTTGQTTTSATTLTNLNFTVVPLMAITNTLTLSGPISGIGTIYCQGLTIGSNVTYNSGAAAAIIVNGNMTVGSGVTSIAGYYYVTGTVTTSGPLTVNGSLVVVGNLNLSNSLSINYDSRIWTQESLAKSLILPGA